jgi:hypothetical protein
MAYKDREVQLQAQRDHYYANKDDYISKNQARRKERREWYLNILSTKFCIVCQEATPECLSWHHLDPKEKDDGVPQLLNSFRSKERILKEMDKCVVLCENCHRKVHSGRIVL